MNRFQGSVCAVVGVMASASFADMINIAGDIGNSTGQTGTDFSGTIEYTFNGGSSGTAVIVLSNDTPGNIGGYLTGFVFNIASTDGGASATLTGATNTFFLNTGSESGQPFGIFDAGAALGANWEGGGAPGKGLGVGQSGTFTFDVVAADAGSLSAASFINGDNDYNFAVRFRGLADGSSDKVPVPAPAGLAALALARGLAGRRRR